MDHFAYNVQGRHYWGGACTVILKVTIHDSITIQIKIIEDKRCVGKNSGVTWKMLNCLT